MRLEEDFVLQLPFLLPEDGYSCDIVRGVPGGLVDFVAPLQQVSWKNLEFKGTFHFHKSNLSRLACAP